MTRFLLAVPGVLAAVASATAGPTDLFAEKVKDFGTTPRGPVLVHYFRFTNTTNQTLSIGQPRVSCGCTSATMSKFQVAPGETAAVIAYMDTRRITTPNTLKSVIVYVPFYSPQVEEVALRVQTVCRDDLMMSPDTLAFGTLAKGKGATATTKVTFTSDPNWKITEAASTGGYVKVACKLDSRTAGSVTYEVTATLDKDCPAGNWVSDVNLTTNNTAVGKLRIPVTVNVTAPLAVNPEALSFGEVNLGTSVEKQLTLKSGTPFRILEVKGTDAQLEVKADTDDAKAAHSLTVLANPKAAGGFARSLEILTDSKEQPRVVVPVTARFVGP